MANNTFINLDNIKILFWDFDGVIKDSVSVKTDAFVELFEIYGKEFKDKVKQHHIKNSGVSRYEKIPTYLEWCGIKPTNSEVQNLCDQFGRIVKKRVISCSWVSGVEEFLDCNYKKYIFIMVSATPQEELLDICKTLKINHYFNKIYGSPTSKYNAIKKSISHYNISSDECLMFGDAKADIDAAKENNIKFIFRKHKLNQNLNLDPQTVVINDFNNI